MSALSVLHERGFTDEKYKSKHSVPKRCHDAISPAPSSSLVSHSRVRRSQPGLHQRLRVPLGLRSQGHGAAVLRRDLHRGRLLQWYVREREGKVGERVSWGGPGSGGGGGGVGA